MEFEEKYKTTIDLLHKSILENASKNKPLLPHLLRVGNFLHEGGYSDEVVNAGLLHDIIEWTDSPKEFLREEFGEHVYQIVLANTKNREIADPAERREDYVSRCAKVGIDALIVKAADTLDSYKYYSEQNNPSEIERCRNIAQLILEKVHASDDLIFKKLQDII
jgi:(p)ppGpp synthase/HD superfamily hydrolase